MSRNLVYIVSIADSSAKVDHSLYSKHCIESWEYYCKRNDIDLFVKTDSDPRCGKPIWNKELVFEHAQGYDKVAVVDADTMIKWDAPNLFDEFDEELCMVNDDTNLNWIYNSVSNYSKFFPNLDLDIDEYGNAGVIFFHSKFLKVFENVFNFYLDNKQELDNWNKGGGREQTIFNFTLKSMGIKPKILSPKWNLISMHKRGLFMNNFQFQDNTPHFIKYGYIWHFTGFAIEDRIKVVNDTWNIIKQNYDL